MFISRKRLEEMESKIEQLEYDLEALGNIHNVKKLQTLSGLPDLSFYHHSKLNESVETELLGSVTLQDIASLLIDHKPIVREDNIKIRKEFGIR